MKHFSRLEINQVDEAEKNIIRIWDQSFREVHILHFKKRKLKRETWMYRIIAEGAITLITWVGIYQCRLKRP